MNRIALVLTCLVFLGLGSIQLKAQTTCTMDLSSKFVLKLTCPTKVDDVEFDLNTSLLPFKSEAVVKNFCPAACNNLITFSPIPGTKNLHVELLQKNTPEGAWKASDWNVWLERNATRWFRLMELMNQ
jgi:hypothetical protein